MPTNKKRVGFIPRSNVLALINKLSSENNLSYSKIVNILVEEALHKRGLFNNSTKEVSYINEKNQNRNDLDYQKKEIVNNEFKYNFKYKLLNDECLDPIQFREEPLDNEMYAKFLMFLQFQERMKKKL